MNRTWSPVSYEKQGWTHQLSSFVLIGASSTWPTILECGHRVALHSGLPSSHILPIARICLLKSAIALISQRPPFGRSECVFYMTAQISSASYERHYDSNAHLREEETADIDSLERVSCPRIHTALERRDVYISNLNSRFLRLILLKVRVARSLTP